MTPCQGLRKREAFDLDLWEDEYDTVRGYVLGLLGRIAVVDDDVALNGGQFRVVEMDGRRIDRLAFVRETGSPGKP